MSSCTPIATATVVQTNVVTAKQTRTVTTVQTIPARRARFVIKRQESDTASQGASESASTGTTIPTSPTSEPTTIATTPTSSPDFTPTPTTEQSEPSSSNNDPTSPPNTSQDSNVPSDTTPPPSDTPPSDPPPVSSSTPVSPPQDPTPTSDPPSQETTTPPPPPVSTTDSPPPPPPDTTTDTPPPTTTAPPPLTTTDPPPPTTTDPPPPPTTTITDTPTPTTTAGGGSGAVTTIVSQEVDDVVLTTVVAQTLFASCGADISATGTVTLSPITLAPELPTTTDTSNGYLTTMPNGQTLSISGGVTIVISEIITNSDGHLTTVIVPLATLSPDAPRLTPSQRDGIIAGSLLGTFTLVLSIIAIIFFVRRRQVRQREEAEAQLPQPRRLLETEDQFDLAAPIDPNTGVGWQSGAPMSQYDDPFASHVSLGMSSAVAGADLDGPPRLLRPRTSVSGSIFHEAVWPPPGHMPVDPIVSASNIDLHDSITSVMGPEPAVLAAGRSSTDSEAGDDLGIFTKRSSIHSRGGDSTRPLLGREPASPVLGNMTLRSTSPTSSLPPHTGLPRPSSPTSIHSSPISISSRSVMVPSPAAIAKAQEARASSSGSRFGRSRLGLVSSIPRSTESSDMGHGSSSDHQHHYQRDSITAPLIDLRATSPSEESEHGGGGRDEHRGFREAMGARLGVLGLGGGPSPGATPLENEIPPLYSMIRRDTDISIERAQRAREEAERDREQEGAGPSSHS